VAQIKSLIIKAVEDSIDAKKSILSQSDTIEKIAGEIINAYKRNNKILICGNGGSAADAQHFAAELVCRFKKDRMALPAIALHTDTSAMTAIGNDYGFEKVFARQVEALGSSGDILFAISTSGNSKNVIEAIKAAKEKEMITVGLLGNDGGLMKGMCDFSVIINSRDTARIQESHITVIHILCEIIENSLFGSV
jgi:D-sedoheptulose 7-phosphate isomerase